MPSQSQHQRTVYRNPQLNRNGELVHLLSVEGLPRDILTHILDTATRFVSVSDREVKKVPLLRGKSVFNLFFENSTRTRTTFEIAATRLSADVINLDIARSSASKGESLLDTIANLSAMAADLFVVRHSESGAPYLIAQHVAPHVHVINAGDGRHAHPTQGLLDMYTIRHFKQEFSNLCVAIVGDVLHSRVARSDIHALTTLGCAEVRVVGPIVALKWTMTNIYGVAPGEVYWAASDVGWVVGHSYIVYAPLFNGNTTILYEGKPVGTPDAGAFWRVIADHKVAAMFTAPTAFRAIKKEDPEGKLIGDYDLSNFRTLFLAGERTDPDTLHWAEDKLGVPVIDHWWQTETGWSICANCIGIEPLPIKEGSPTKPVPGVDVRVLDEAGNEAKPGEIGALTIKLPLPPGTFTTLWGADQRFIDSYMAHFPGYYETADAGFIDEDGYVFVMSRTDDIINVAGHRLSTGGMEEVLAAHPDVAECAVVGVADQLKGQLPVGFLVLSAGVDRDHAEIVAEVIAMVRKRIGPVAAFKSAAVVARLPKTRSGKILRGTMQKIADCEDYKMPATIDDPAILDEIAEALTGIGYAGARSAAAD